MVNAAHCNYDCLVSYCPADFGCECNGFIRYILHTIFVTVGLSGTLLTRKCLQNTVIFFKKSYVGSSSKVSNAGPIDEFRHIERSNASLSTAFSADLSTAVTVASVGATGKRRRRSITNCAADAARLGFIQPSVEGATPRAATQRDGA